MFTVGVETYFKASHQLTLPSGSKEPLHRHNWRVVAEVSGEELNRMGLVIDFGRLRALLEGVVGELDGVVLEESEYFRRNSSSAENVCRYIYERLEGKLPGGVRLEWVKVVEEQGCWVKFVKQAGAE